jgi:hypothetical protein
MSAVANQVSSVQHAQLQYSQQSWLQFYVVFPVHPEYCNASSLETDHDCCFRLIQVTRLNPHLKLTEADSSVGNNPIQHPFTVLITSTQHISVVRHPTDITQHISLVLTYLLTHSIQHSPSWEANLFVTSQEIPCVLLNPKVHYRIHKCPPPVSILSQSNPVHTPTSHFLKIHSNISLPSMPGAPQWSLSLKFPPQNSIHASPLAWSKNQNMLDWNNQ